MYLVAAYFLVHSTPRKRANNKIPHAELQVPWGSKRRTGSGGTRRPRDLGGSTAAPGTTEAGSTRRSACLAGPEGPSG